MKKEKRNKGRPIAGAIFGTIMIICATAIIIAFMTTKSNIDVSCEISEIEYTDVRPKECWHPEIADEFCPLPTGLACQFKGDTNALTLSNIIAASLN